MATPPITGMENWRISLLGDAGSGKAALTAQFVYDYFVETYDPTIDPYHKQLVVDDQVCIVETIYTADQDEYAMLHDQRVHEGQGFIIVYSIDSRSTFDRVEIFHDLMRRIRPDNPVFMLVGNNCDRIYEREVAKEEGAALACQWGCKFIETSPKTAKNVQQLFIDLVRALRKRRTMTPAIVKKQKLQKCVIM